MLVKGKLICYICCVQELANFTILGKRQYLDELYDVGEKKLHIAGQIELFGKFSQ